MRRFLRVIGSLAGLAAIGALLTALALTFSGQLGSRGQPQVVQQPYPPPQTPTPGPYPPPGTPAPTLTPFPTVTPGGIPPTPPPTPSPIEIVLTPVPPEVTDALTQPIQITTRPASRSELAVDGNYVVWRSYEDNQTNIVAYNLATGEERRISSLPGGKSSLAVSGRYVVWEETIQETFAHVIRVYDLARQEERQISSGDGYNHSPDISGHIVVWNDRRHWTNDQEQDIYGYDLQRNEEFPVVVGPGRHMFPRTSGDWVIYLDWPPEAPLGGLSSQPTLRAHHLPSGEDIELGPAYYRNDASCCEGHTISGHRVVWSTGRELHRYNLDTRQERTLPDEMASRAPALRGNLLLAGGRVFNVETGNMLPLFQGLDRTVPTILAERRAVDIDEVATDGQTVVWTSGPRDGEHVYIARLRRLP